MILHKLYVSCMMPRATQKLPVSLYMYIYFFQIVSVFKGKLPATRCAVFSVAIFTSL